MTPEQFSIFFAVAVFVLGASIGSFLNVCIYRMPRELSVNEPRRSFCPSCKYQIPWWRNLPLLSWLLLRGKCANCGAPISFRYFGVELLTGLLFLAVWLKFWPTAEWIVALPYFVMLSLFVVATFIDFEFFIIPDEVSWGGAIAGVLLSFAIPTLHREESNLIGGLWGLAGAATGVALVWLVVNAGKLAFGKKEVRLDGPTEFSWTRIPGTKPEGGDSDATLLVGDVAWKEQPAPGAGARLQEIFHRFLHAVRLAKRGPAARGEKWLWSEMDFFRPSDLLIVQCDEVEIDGEKLGASRLTFSAETLTVAERMWRLEKTDLIRGTTTRVVIPREAMGFGDVAFMACIGAFLGVKAVFFTLAAASIVGAIVGVLAILVGRREFSMKIPFGPYLALGALIWLFTGRELLDWYFNSYLAMPPGM